jgi:3-oxoacyl-[acyl-carrier-protein] synthase I
MTMLRISHYTVTSALGRGRSAHWQALSNAQSSLRPAPFLDADIACQLGTVDGLAAPLPPALAKFECRNNRLAWLGLQQDGFLTQAAGLRERYGPDRVGVFIGTSTSGIHSTELAYQQWRESLTAGVESHLPDWFDYQYTQSLFSVADFTALALDLHGPALTISTACSSSAKVFATAWRHIQSGLCDAAVVGGVDSLCLTTLYGFNSLQLVSKEVCRPADAQRQGISIGEAAGFAIVEKPNNSSEGALPFGLLGYGETGDAHHMSSPDPQGRGAEAAMRLALHRAQLKPDAVDYVNLHGTGTVANDAAEDRAVVAVFGSGTACSSTKGWTGHTLGAAGIVEASISLLCIEHGFMPQSLNTQVIDSTFGSNILLQARAGKVRRVISNSFGFGGSNCSLLLGALP